MSLGKYMKVSGGPKPDEAPFFGLELEVEAPSRIADELVKRYKELRYVKDKLGFLPVSVWIPTKRGSYRDLVQEYTKYYHELKLIPTKRHGTSPFDAPVEAKNVYDRILPVSLRNPLVDEWVFKIWGGRGYTIYNCFLGHTVEYIVFGGLGAKKYIGGTVNRTILMINEDFYRKHKHLLPQDYEVVFLEEDATEMRDIQDNSIDLIWASPPYWKAERLKSDHPHELANAETYDEFLEMYAKCFKQMYRVMKPDRFVVLQVADVRFEDVFYPLHVDTIELAQEAGLSLHDIVIMYNFSYWANLNVGRAETKRYTSKVHEYLLVFRRP
jgi:hypothetical protein